VPNAVRTTLLGEDGADDLAARNAIARGGLGGVVDAMADYPGRAGEVEENQEMEKSRM
jgi:hypothetical protein